MSTGHGACRRGDVLDDVDEAAAAVQLAGGAAAARHRGQRGRVGPQAVDHGAEARPTSGSGSSTAPPWSASQRTLSGLVVLGGARPRHEHRRRAR